PAGTLAKQITLGHLQRRYQDLALSTGEDFHRRLAIHLDPEVRPVGPKLGMPGLPVPLQAIPQQFPKVLGAIPSRLGQKSDAGNNAEPRTNLTKNRLERLGVEAAKIRYPVGNLDKFPVPDRHLQGIDSTMPEQGIAVLQAALKPTPEVTELLFHVEHTPIQKGPAVTGGSLQQLEAVAVEELDRQGLTEPRGTAHNLPPHLEEKRAIRGPIDADGAGAPLLIHPGDNAGAIRALMIVPGAYVAGANGAAPGQQVNRFEQTGLAAAVDAVDEIGPRDEGDIDGIQVTQAGHGQSLEIHCRGNGKEGWQDLWNTRLTGRSSTGLE